MATWGVWHILLCQIFTGSNTGPTHAQTKMLVHVNTAIPRGASRAEGIGKPTASRFLGRRSSEDGGTDVSGTECAGVPLDRGLRFAGTGKVWVAKWVNLVHDPEAQITEASTKMVSLVSSTNNNNADPNEIRDRLPQEIALADENLVTSQVHVHSRSEQPVAKRAQR